MDNYSGHCEGKCYKCVCQECEGNCAMNCLIQSHPEKTATMNCDETHVVQCCEFEQITE